MNRLGILSFFLLLIVVVCPEGRAADYKFRHYTVENGLASNTVRDIMQDRSGYIWVATLEGVTRFSGMRYTTFRTVEGEKREVMGEIKTLLEDSDGKIWFGGKGKIFIYDPATEKISGFEGNDRIGNGAVVRFIVQDGAGNIWIAVLGKGLYRYNRKSRDFVRYYKDTEDPEHALKQDNVTQLMVDRQGRLWGGYSGIPFLFCYDAGEDRFDHLEVKTDLEGVGTGVICEDSFGNIWGVRHGGLEFFRVDKETHQVSIIASPDDRPLVNILYTMIEYKPGVFVIGTNDGLLFYDVVDKSYQKVECNPQYSGLNDYFIHALLRDREGGLWVGSYYGGVNYLSPLGYGFELCQLPPRGGGLSRFIVSRFCEDPSGNIWVGSDNGGVAKYDPKTGELTHFPIDAGKYHPNVHALYADSSSLLVGAYTGGVRRVDSRGKVLRHYRPGSSVTSLFRDRGGRMWLGSTNVVALYHPERDQFLDVFNAGPYSDVADITDDPDGNVWFASLGGGVLCCPAGTDTLVRYTCGTDEKDFITNKIHSLCFHKDRLWVGTATDGLCWFDRETKELRRSPMNIESAGLAVYYITGDRDYLWMTTSRGLIRYAIGSGRTVSYGREDGLQGKVFNPNAGFRSHDGKIYIGGSNGFNIFDPRGVPDNSYPAPIVFTGFRVFNELLPVDSAGILQKSIDNQRSVVLKAKQNAFSVDFSALTYCMPSKVMYRYRLLGLNDTWMDLEPGALPSVSYTNLPSGDYQFQVEAYNSIDSLPPQTATLAVTILHPWWATVWMRLLYALMTCGLIGGLFLWGWGRERRKQQKQYNEMYRRNRQELLESKIRIFQEVAHEIRTPVTLIAAPAEEMMNCGGLPEEARENLEVITSNSRHLVSLMDQVLDFSRAESGYQVMNCVDVRIADYLSDIVGRFLGETRRRGIACALEYDGPDFVVRIDMGAFDKVVSNLLTNALKYARCEIRVMLAYAEEEKRFRVTVWDDGEGIRDQEKIFDLFYREPSDDNSEIKGFGIGLAVVRLLLGKMDAVIRVESEPGKYALFEVTFPLAASYPEEKKEVEAEIEDMENESDNDTREVLLIVDDHKSLRNFLCRSLGRTYRVLAAADGVEALEMLRRHRVDMVVSDVMMSGMDGWTLCSRIKNDLETNHIPVILLTARTDTESKVKALENGADVYVEKPVVMEYLRAQISGLLEIRRQLQKKYSRMSLLPAERQEQAAPGDQLIDKLHEIIENNLSNSEFSMDEIAREIGVSRSVMYAKIKTVTGLTPNDFVRMIRLKKAAELLTSGGGYKVNEVCYLVGFSTPSYFAKCFQQQFGVLPKDLVIRNKQSE